MPPVLFSDGVVGRRDGEDAACEGECLLFARPERPASVFAVTKQSGARALVATDIALRAGC